MFLTLPLPPTKNNLRYSNHTKTQAYRDFEQMCDFIWIRDGFNKIEILTPSYKQQMVFEVAIYLKDQRADPENYFEAVRDWLKGKLYTDDKWVFLRIVNFPLAIDKKNPRIEINIRPQIFSEVTKIKINSHD